MTEIWKPVPRYEGLYEASNLGHIRRASRSKRAPAGYVLKPGIGHGRGDRYVDLCKNGVSRKYLVARVICTTFNGPCPPGKNCNHIDGDLANNSAVNLEWITYSENMLHSYRVLGRKAVGQKGSRNGRSKVYVITDPNGREFEIKGLKEFCREYNLRSAALLVLARGHYKGYKCRYP